MFTGEQLNYTKYGRHPATPVYVKNEYVKHPHILLH